MACVAHELRTPLATQRALIELALADPNTDAAAWREIGEEMLGLAGGKSGCSRRASSSPAARGEAAVRSS